MRLNQILRFLAVLLCICYAAPLMAQDAKDRPKKACCSNFRVYTENLQTELNKLCDGRNKKSEITGIVKKFIETVGAVPGANQAPACSHIKPELKVGDESVKLDGCYDPRKLLEHYMASYGHGLKLCPPQQGVGDPPKVPNPCDPPKDDNGCGNTTIVVMPLPYGTGNVVQNFNTFNFNVSYALGEDNRSEKPLDPKAPEPLQPQVPTENVFGTSQSGLLQPSETRLAAVQMPVVITDNGAFGTAGVSFAPYKIYRIESDSAVGLGVLRKVPLLGRYLERLNISLGATKSPGTMDQGASANGAAAVSLQHHNDHDPYLNTKFGKCLDDAAKAIINARKEACKDTKDDAKRKVCLEELMVLEQAESRKRFRSCLAQFARSASSSVFGASAEIAKFWYTYEGSIDWYLSWVAYGGMQYNRRQGVYVPAEAGGQINLTTPSLSAHADISLMAGATDGMIKLRPSGGLGIALPIFNGMTATFAARVMPLPWNESWGHNPLSQMEKRYIVGIGWAGDDASIMYYRKTLEGKKP